MIRILNVILAIIVVLTAVLAYTVKLEAHRLKKTEQTLARKISNQEIALAAWRAEWAYTESPSYLLQLHAEFGDSLQLGIRQSGQLRRLEEIPFRKSQSSAAQMVQDSNMADTMREIDFSDERGGDG